MLQEEQSHLPVAAGTSVETLESMSSGGAVPLPPVHCQGTPGNTLGEETLSLWLKLGAVDKLEQAVLDGYGQQLVGRSSRLPQVNKFLKQVPQFQHKIRELHRAVAEGDLRAVRHLLDRRKLALSRDHIGASPLHKAVLYGHSDIIAYMLERHPAALHARDHQGRTPLHYAAFLQDRGAIYDCLVEAGADPKATDIYGRMAEEYLQSQDDTVIQQIREGMVGMRRINAKITGRNKLQSRPPGGGLPGVERREVREVLTKGDLAALEDLVLQGYGTSLLGRSSEDCHVQEFLNSVPQYMERIYEIHRAAMRGRLQETRRLLEENEKLAVARDQLGATPLHKAVWYSRPLVAQYIATHFPAALSAKDMEGRTALHYAASQGDGKEMYTMLLAAGASKHVLDCWDKTPEHYLHYPDQLCVEDAIRRSQRANASHLTSTINHYRYKFANASTPSDGSSAASSESGDRSGETVITEKRQESVVDTAVFRASKGSRNMSQNGESLIQSNPPLPILRLRISSATIRQWLREDDVEKLELAVLEGYGEKVARESTMREDLSNGPPETVRRYVQEVVPSMVEAIHAVHTAVAEDDLAELQNRLSGDQARLALAKDPMGMTPLHHAVVLRHTKIVKFLVDKYPETINARDKEGRTPLHYAALVSRNDGMNTYKLLVLAGADPRVRDQHGRTPDYYRNHPMFIPNAVLSKSKASNTRWWARNMEPLSRLGRNGILEKISNALRSSDVDQLREVVLEGYGKMLQGKTSWNEDVRQFLKSVPQYMNTIKVLQDAVRSGNVARVESIIEGDESLLRCRDETGATPIHLAAANNQTEVLKYFLDNYPVIVNVKDAYGRTAMHLACQMNLTHVYKMLQEGGADSMILDQKGRTPEYYLVQGSNGLSSRYYSSSRKPLPSVEPLPSLNGPGIIHEVGDNYVNGLSTEEDDDDVARNNYDEEEPMKIENDIVDIQRKLKPSEDQSDEENNAQTEEKEGDNGKEELYEEEESPLSSSQDQTASNVDSINNKDDIEATGEDQGGVTNETSLPSENLSPSKTSEGGVQKEEQSNEDPSLDESLPTSVNINGERYDIIVEDGDAKKEESLDSSDNNESEDVQNDGSSQNNNDPQNINIDNDESQNSLPTGVKDEINPTESKEETNESNNSEPAKEEEEADSLSSPKIEPDTGQGEEGSKEIEVESGSSSSPKIETDTGQGEEGSKEIEDSDQNLDSLKSNEEKGDDSEMSNNQQTGESLPSLQSNEIKSMDDIQNDINDANPEFNSEVQDGNNEEPSTTITEENNNTNDVSAEKNDNLGEVDKSKESDASTEDNPERMADNNEDQQADEGNNSLSEPNEPESPSESLPKSPSDAEDKRDYEMIGGAEQQQINPEIQRVGNDEVELIPRSFQTGNKAKQDDGRERESLQSQGEEGTANNAPDAGDNTSTNSRDHLDELIDQWIRDGDLLRLEHVVLAGQGERLTEKSSPDRQVQDFLDLVPMYMAKIRTIHEAVVRGNVREVRAVLTRKRFALSRDGNGASPLHLAVLYSHPEIIHYIVTQFPETMDGPDNEGRTPLHYAAVLQDGGHIYIILRDAGADENIPDKAGNSPKFYLSNPGVLNIQTLLNSYRPEEER